MEDHDPQNRLMIRSAVGLDGAKDPDCLGGRDRIDGSPWSR